MKQAALHIDDKQRENMASVKTLLSERYGEEHIPLAHVHSFGCQQNTADSEIIKGLLALMGYGFTDVLDNADLVIYNTCAVRENAEDKVFGFIGELKHYKSRNPAMLIGICGCMVQQEHTTAKIKRSYPQIDIVFGTHVLHELPGILQEALRENRIIINTRDSEGIIVEGLPVLRDCSYKASVPIMYGCNNFCTYCIVPYVRGRERSREPSVILDEVASLVQSGCKEITLLGQNVNSYGRGLTPSVSFSELLHRLNEIEGDFLIRFMTSHPKDATTELIDTMAECGKVAKHLHLPVQSGSNRILSLMNRGYTAEQYLSLVRYAKERVPGISFTSDSIVGFPGETYEDFLQTLDLVRRVEFDHLYTFLYSRRSGTKAALMPDTATEDEKGAWFRELLGVQLEIGSRLYKRFIGQTLRVLVDGKGKSGEGMLTGRSNESIIVEFEGATEQIGSFVDVKITKAMNWAVIGEMENASNANISYKL